MEGRRGGLIDGWKEDERIDGWKKGGIIDGWKEDKWIDG